MMICTTTSGARHQQVGGTTEQTVVTLDGRHPFHVGALYVFATVTDQEEADAVERFLEERRLRHG